MEMLLNKCKCGKTINKDYEYCENHCIHNTEDLDWKDTADGYVWCRHCGAMEYTN